MLARTRERVTVSSGQPHGWDKERFCLLCLRTNPKTGVKLVAVVASCSWRINIGWKGEPPFAGLDEVDSDGAESAVIKTLNGAHSMSRDHQSAVAWEAINGGGWFRGFAPSHDRIGPTATGSRGWAPLSWRVAKKVNGNFAKLYAIECRKVEKGSGAMEVSKPNCSESKGSKRNRV